MNRSLFERCLAEVAGTALLVAIGTGSIVAGANAGGVPQYILAVTWFVAVAVPVLAFAFVSGAHINPAVTVALVVSGRFPLRETGPYVAAQIAGAFGGSLAVWGVLGRGADLGATVPGRGGLLWVLPLEFAFTALLVSSVFFLTAPGKLPARAELLLPAAVVGVSTYLIGPWTGSSLNPARTLAPAVLSGDFEGIGVYFAATLLAAVLVARIVRRRTFAVPRDRPRRT